MIRSPFRPRVAELVGQVCNLPAIWAPNWSEQNGVKLTKCDTCERGIDHRFAAEEREQGYRAGPEHSTIASVVEVLNRPDKIRTRPAKPP